MEKLKAYILRLDEDDEHQHHRGYLGGNIVCVRKENEGYTRGGYTYSERASYAF